MRDIKIFVTAKAGAKNTKIKKIDETHFAISVQEPPREGKANYAVTKALAEYFNVPTSNITLLSGSTSKQKVFEII